MQKILWTGESGFCRDLESCGWPESAYVTIPENGHTCWNELVEKAGFIPDVLVVAPGKHLPFVLGMENFPCFTIFYSASFPRNPWHNLYAQAYDACLVSYYDNLDYFIGPFMPRERVWWSPPYAPEVDRLVTGADDNQEIDCVHMGRNADNGHFLKSMQKNLPRLRHEEGIPAGQYSIVVLENDEMEDFRPMLFEAMARGNCLVAPRGGEDQHKLFVDGEHLVLYRPGDIGDAFYRIDFLLKHPEIARYISETAREEINSKHLSRHRAESLTYNLCDLAMQDLSLLIAPRQNNSRLIQQNCLFMPYLIMAGKTSGEASDAYHAAAKGEYGLSGMSG